MWRETRFRRFFHSTHQEYLHEPFRIVEWMIAIAEMEEGLRGE